MSKDPWKYKTWSERQAAWFMAELPEIDFEAGKVEGETDDAFFGLEYPESAWIEYQATNDLKAIMRSKPAIIGAPVLSHPTTAEGKRAHGCLERLRTAVKWGRLQPVDGQALCWTGEMWKKIPIDEIPKDVCPIRFSVDKQELKRWMAMELLDTKQQTASTATCESISPNAFFVLALRLAKAGNLDLSHDAGKPGQVVERIRQSWEAVLPLSDFTPPTNSKAIRAEIKHAIDPDYVISAYPDIQHAGARKRAQALIYYAAACHNTENTVRVYGQSCEVAVSFLKALTKDHVPGLQPTTEQWRTVLS